MRKGVHKCKGCTAPGANIKLPNQGWYCKACAEAFDLEDPVVDTINESPEMNERIARVARKIKERKMGLFYAGRKRPRLGGRGA